MTVTTTPQQIAQSLLQRLEDAWNRADGDAFGAVYTDDAAFVTIRGDFVRGSAAIAAGHGEIFATIYAGSRNHMELLDAEPLSDGVVIAHSRNTLDAPGGPLQGVHQAMSTSVLVRDGAEWRIVATHNTLVVAPPGS